MGIYKNYPKLKRIFEYADVYGGLVKGMLNRGVGR